MNDIDPELKVNEQSLKELARQFAKAARSKFEQGKIKKFGDDEVEHLIEESTTKANGYGTLTKPPETDKSN